jgi:predicted SAM-dependent methyltransferase
MLLSWDDVARRQPIRLNLGGGPYSDPHPRYPGYVAIDREPSAPLGVAHDLTQPIPLPDDSVERILSDHFLEHLKVDEIRFVLAECWRLLVPGGIARIGVPDYGHPRERHHLRTGRDDSRRDHQTLTTGPLMRELVAQSPFGRGEFYHHWEGDEFVQRPMDYALGFLQRTPDNDRRNFCRGFRQHLGRLGRDLGMVLRRGPWVRRIDFETRRYHRLAVTSVVFDLVKPASQAAPAP